jgi:hypothetical protein
MQTARQLPSTPARPNRSYDVLTPAAQAHRRRDAFREATSCYQATEAGTARRVEAFIHMLVAERMLASLSSGSTERIAPKDPE